ncbi:L2 capsid protein [Bos taurus papillomavirus 17]|uniref:Minor capsid protein L2 n=1 Tax=Bos taurus papillomavirus 17 TaxID=1887215 RepID=A0A1B2K260_9PAPI|nr:L2 capsid protein [Bos taurus papillomavirus 17]ANZ90242.1 L2 capsid protein [Bos taurus papillomavirus 17]
MVRAARRKRASEDQLYKDCLEGRDCKPDVQNKYTQNTLADKFLKWISGVLFFGNLGIGTGKGTGGRLGYTPLGGSGVQKGLGPNVAKPTVIVDALPPPGATIDVLSPESSSIIPLLEDTLTEVPTTDISSNEVEVIAEIHPAPGPTGGSNGTVVGSSNSDIPLIEISPETTPVSRTRVTSTTHSNPTFNAIVSTSRLPGVSSVSDNVYVMHGVVGQTIGPTVVNNTFEEIPLTDFTPSRLPETSTPETSFGNEVRRIAKSYNIRNLYNRRLTQQVQVQDRRFFTRPEQLISWEFSNPAYDSATFDNEVTRIFEQDVDTVNIAPVQEFQDVVQLGRPFFSEVDGYLRYSRLGRRATIRTRSGATIGGAVHFYSDISPINPSEEIALHNLGQHTGESSLIQPLNDSTVIDETINAGVLFDPDMEVEDLEQNLLPDESLFDDYPEDFSRTKLQFSGSRRSTSMISYPGTIPPGSVGFLVPGAGTVIGPPEPTPFQPSPDLPDILPPYIIDFNDNSATFYLHPSLIRRKRRKRKRIFS